MAKPRHEAGYQVDGVIYARPSPILLEIKTDASAADVYEGVGQLMLYYEMLHLVGHRRILLLPKQPHEVLVSAVKACGMEVYDYHLSESDGILSVTFSAAFLAACGVQ
jgi:hypothetical protein